MKKILIAGLVLVAALVFVTIALPLLISSEAVRSSLLQRAKEITGREMIFRGDPSVAFSPFLGIEIQDVEFRSRNNAESPILAMPTLRGKLSITSALRGRVEIDEFQFVRPVFRIDIDENGTTSWAFPDGDVWQILREARTVREETETGQTPNIAKVPNAELGKFTVFDGLINFNDSRTGRKETVSNFNGTLIWPDTRSAWTFEGEGIWRGDTVTANMVAQTPIMLLAGGSSQLTTSIQSEPINLNFSGEANRFADLFFAGKLQATSPSLRRTINFFGGDSGSGASFSNFTANGEISGTLHDLQLQEAKLNLDDNQYSGSLRLSANDDGSNRLSGTLAAETMNVQPYMGALGSVEGIRSLFRILNTNEMDVRLSSKNVDLGNLTVNDFAGGLIAREDSFKLDIGNANIGEGIVVGNLTAATMEDKVSVGMEINASNINPSQIAGFDKFSGVRPLGRSKFSVKLQSDASDGETLGSAVTGSFSMTMKNGALTGLDFSQLRASLERENQPAENIQIGGAGTQTPVREFVLNATVNQGVAWIGESSFLIEEFKSYLSGKADLRTGNLAMWGLLERPDAEGKLQSHSQYFLGGTLAEPLYVPQFLGRSPLPQPVAPPSETEPTTNTTN